MYGEQESGMWDVVNQLPFSQGRVCGTLDFLEGVDHPEVIYGDEPLDAEVAQGQSGTAA